MQKAHLKWQQIVLVSDRYNLRRVKWTFQKVLGSEVTIQTSAIPATSAVADSYWWRHPESRRWVISETYKLIFYWFYYGLFGSQQPLSPRDFANLAIASPQQPVPNFDDELF